MQTEFTEADKKTQRILSEFIEIVKKHFPDHFIQRHSFSGGDLSAELSEKNEFFKTPRSA